MLENFKAGALARYGLDAASLRAVNPRLIYCSVTGFGQDGPRADQAAYDFAIQAMGGLMSITGERDDAPGGGPQKVGVPIVDLMTGMYAAVAILAALARRGETGGGETIDLAMLDVAGGLPREPGDELASLGPRAAARRQPPPQHPAAGRVPLRGRPARARGRQRRAVPQALRGARPPRMVGGRALRHQRRPRPEQPRADAAARRALPRLRARRADGGAGRGGRALRADQRDPAGLRRPADPAPRRCCATSPTRVAGTVPQVVSPLRFAEKPARASTARRPPSASTRRRCWRSSGLDDEAVAGLAARGVI